MRISLNSSDSVKSPGRTNVNEIFFTHICCMCGHVHMSQHPKKIREQQGGRPGCLFTLWVLEVDLRLSVFSGTHFYLLSEPSHQP